MRLRGDFDLERAPVLRDRLRTVAADNERAIIDLTDATFMDTSTVHVLVELRKAGFGITLRGRGPARRVIDLMGLDAMFEVEDHDV